MKTVTFAVVLACSPSAHAYGTGNELLEALSSARDIPAVMFVSGLVRGMQIGHGITGPNTDQHARKLGFCIPTQVTNGQLADVVKKYLVDNPASRHGAASLLTYASMLAAFPCK